MNNEPRKRNLKPKNARKMNRPSNSPINFDILHQDIQDLNSKVDRVLRTLIGDAEMEQEGLVSKVAKHEKFIVQQKLLMAKFSGVAIGAGALGGILFEVILKYVIK